MLVTGADPEILQGGWLEGVCAIARTKFFDHTHFCWPCACAFRRYVHVWVSGCWTNLFQRQWVYLYLSIGSHWQSSRGPSDHTQIHSYVASLATTVKGLGVLAGFHLGFSSRGGKCNDCWFKGGKDCSGTLVLLCTRLWKCAPQEPFGYLNSLVIWYSTKW